ncbi:MAG: response regulator transcription factor, partial [Candidatus Dormibacterales bacterium]
MNALADHLDLAAPVPARILVVDDEPGIRDLVARGLGACGYAVAVAKDGSSGLEAALSQPYDLVILDLVMPDLEGSRFLRHLLDQRPRQPVIVVSALTDTGTKVDCLRLGAEDYLAKPFSLDELAARVHARIRSARSGTARLTAGELTLDLVRRRADRGEGPVVLPEREFLLLQELMRNLGRTLSKGHLLDTVWG